MPYNSRYFEGDVYLVVKKSTQWSRDLSVVKATNTKPQTTVEDSIVLKLKLQIPKSAFDPIEPEATIVVPEDLVQHPIQAVAEDPDADSYPETDGAHWNPDEADPQFDDNGNRI